MTQAQTKVSPVEALYRSRCTTKSDASLMPTYWRPQPLKYVAPCLFGDTRKQLSDEQAEQASKSMRRCIALGLELELPVGQFLMAATKQDLPQIEWLKELLISNIADEAAHYAGFKYAAQAYAPDIEHSDEYAEAVAIRKQWEHLASTAHPLTVAGTLEVGVFLTTLGLMRIIGGPELSLNAVKISEDEARHVRINRSIARKMGDSIKQLPLIDETLRWVVGDLSIKVAGNQAVDFAFLRQSSQDLIETGISQDLDDLCNIQMHQLPFERRNRDLYTRATEEGTAAY